MQARGAVLLNYESVAMFGPWTDFQLWEFRLWQAGAFGGRRRFILALVGDRCGFAGRFGRSVEAAFSPIFFKLSHARILPHDFAGTVHLLLGDIGDDSSCALARGRTNLR